MILARPIASERAGDLGLAARRLGLPAADAASLSSLSPRLHLLLTSLGAPDEALLARQGEAYVPGRAPGSALLRGTREGLTAVGAGASAAGRAELATALARALGAGEPPAPLSLGGARFEFGERTYVMGVVNVTPDSFSDGGRFLAPEAAIAHGVELARAGADLLDIGGESTRPGAPRVSIDEELSRVMPVLRGLKERTGVPLSVDTTKAAVAREALSAGATLVNDISGFGFDPALAGVVAEAGAACCLMHIQGTPESMQRAPRYLDLVAEVIEFLAAAIERAVRAGVAREKIVVDPGIGFGKTAAHNLFLLRRLGDLRVLGQPVLVGPSRKAFLGQVVGGKPPAERVVATAGAAAVVAATSGADFIRVHDAAEVCDALAVAEAIRTAEGGGELFEPEG